MVNEDYLETLADGTFLKNAGIRGIIKFFEMNNAEEGKDYKYKGNRLYISKEYLQNNPIPEMYIQSIVAKLGGNTKFTRILNCKGAVINAYKQYTDESVEESVKAEALDKLKVYFKEITDMLLKSSVKTNLELLQSYSLAKTLTVEDVKAIQKEKDITEKYNMYCNMVAFLEQEKVKENMIYTELLYTRLNYFYTQNPTSHSVTALYIKGVHYEDVIRNKYYVPLLEEMQVSEKKKKVGCIECRGLFSKKDLTPSIMADTIDDVKKKTSVFWNCKADAYLCPLCAFIYLFVPLGFVFLGADAVFVNNNSSIREMTNFMDTYEQITDIGKTTKQRLYRVFTSEKIDLLKQRLSNFQVVIRESNFKHYKINIMSRNIIENLQKGKQYLEWLETKYIKEDGSKDAKLISVYDLAFENILMSRTQYALILMLLRYAFKYDKSCNYVRSISNLEILINGGANMDALKSKADVAFMCGKELRNKFIGTSSDDSSLRGVIYMLLNAVSSNDRDLFMQSIIRIYTGANLSIPHIFNDCYTSKEVFKAIGINFILGLKYVKYEKKDEGNNNE